MITKEEAIRIIENHKPQIKATSISARRTNEAFDMAIQALKGGWIPIAEETELPDHDVICCNNEGDIAQGYLYFDEEENQIACDHDPYVMFGVVAYMELPEPYKADMRSKSCSTCKNNDDEFSAECYECVKNIQNHYEPKSEDK